MKMAALLVVGLFLLSGCSRSVNEERAKDAARLVLAKHIRKSARIETWSGMVKASPTESHARATVIIPEGELDSGENSGAPRVKRMTGTFTYHRYEGKGWVLDRVSFTGERMRIWNEDVFQPIPKNAKEAETLFAEFAKANVPPLPPAPGAQPDSGSSPTPDEQTSSSLDVSSARGTAETYVASLQLEGESWRLTEWADLRTSEAGQELPATLIVTTSEGEFRYPGVFVFASEGTRWQLASMSFRRDGSDPIEHLGISQPVE